MKATVENLRALFQVCRKLAAEGCDVFAGAWVKARCDREGVTFHPAWMHRLVDSGVLELGDSSRGGKRRYYKLTNLAA